MLILNVYQRSVKWDIKIDPADPRWLRMNYSEQTLTTVTDLKAPREFNSCSCTFNWHYRIFSRETNELLFHYEFEDCNRVLVKKGFYDPEKIKAMIVFSDIQFLSIFETRKKDTDLPEIEIPSLTTEGAAKIERDVRQHIFALEFPKAKNLSLVEYIRRTGIRRQTNEP